MSKENFQPEKNKKNNDNEFPAIEKVGRAALFAVALAGTGGLASESAEAAQTSTQHEARESFSPEREAQALINQVSALDVGIDDARGRVMFRRKVLEQFNLFVLSFEQHRSYLSAPRNTSIEGQINQQNRTTAAQFLLLKIKGVPNKTDGVRELERIVTNYAFSSQNSTPKGESQMQPQGNSEIRRSRNFKDF